MQSRGYLWDLANSSLAGSLSVSLFTLRSGVFGLLDVCPVVGRDMKESQIVCSDYRVP